MFRFDVRHSPICLNSAKYIKMCGHTSMVKMNFFDIIFTAPKTGEGTSLEHHMKTILSWIAALIVPYISMALLFRLTLFFSRQYGGGYDGWSLIVGCVISGISFPATAHHFAPRFKSMSSLMLTLVMSAWIAASFVYAKRHGLSIDGFSGFRVSLALISALIYSARSVFSEAHEH